MIKAEGAQQSRRAEEIISPVLKVCALEGKRK